MSLVDRSALAERPLAILGPTAVGKSALALALAELAGCAELVSIDSMQVYRGMDVGTATPTPSEQAAVAHHMIDLVDPSEEFSVSEFKDRATAALADIRSRGRVPVLVGGTGLYLRAVIDDLDIPGRYPQVHAELEAEPDTAALHARLAGLDPAAAARMAPSNRRRVIRALEVTLGSGRRFSDYGPGLTVYPPTQFLQLALQRSRPELDQRIAQRWQQQLAEGFLDEVRALQEVPLSRTAAAALGYREFADHLAGRASISEALETAVRRTCRFARRQERWLRRDPRIRWVEAPADPAEILAWWKHAAEGR